MNEPYTTKFSLGIYKDGTYDEEVYGSAEQLCYAVEVAITDLYKIIYNGCGDESTIASKKAITCLQTIYLNAMEKATNDIASGDENTTILFKD